MQQAGLDRRATKRHFRPTLLRPHMTPRAAGTTASYARGPGGFRGGAGVMARAEVFVRRLRPVVACLVAMACGNVTPMPDCRVGADCASGICTREGKCGVASAGGGAAGGSAGGVGGGQAGGSMAGGSAMGGGSAGGAAGGSVTCLPNNDGTITRDEVVTGPGLRATFRVSGQTPFDTAGIGLPDGGRAWDFTPMLTGDMNTLVETEPIQGKWFESNYPDAGYVVPLGQGTDLIAVFTSTADGLYLLGTASPANGPLATRLAYTPPVKILKFPLQAGDIWGTASAVSGTANGIAIFGTTDTYTSTVDRVGEANTPYARFPVLRVRTMMDRSVPLNPFANTSFRQFQYVTECFGTVATVRSRDLETSTEFTTAKEVRRLSP